MFGARYLAAGILQPEKIPLQIRKFDGWAITLEDFNGLSRNEQDAMAEKYAIQSDEELETLRLKAADRTLAEDSADAEPGDLVFMAAERVTPTIKGDSVAFFARTNRFQLMARLKQYYLVECLSRAIDYRLNFQKFVPSSFSFQAWRSSLSLYLSLPLSLALSLARSLALSFPPGCSGPNSTS